MNITLSCTWNPHGESPQLERLWPQLETAYSAIAIAVRPGKLAEVAELNRLDKLTLFEMDAVGWGRYQELEWALADGPDYIHYADLDTILYWVENRAQEWRETLAAFSETDCLVIGRSRRAFETRPQAIRQTERIINRVFSHVLGQEIDFGLGNRGYSRRAAAVIIEQSRPGHWGDAEWPVLIQQAGLKVDYRAIDGADWLPSDRSLAAVPTAAVPTAAARQQLAEAYDHRTKSWARRVQMAQEIIEQGLAVVRDQVRD